MKRQEQKPGYVGMLEYPRNKKEVMGNLRIMAQRSPFWRDRNLAITLAYIINEFGA